jgi:hypothetical protein
MRNIVIDSGEEQLMDVQDIVAKGRKHACCEQGEVFEFVWGSKEN